MLEIIDELAWALRRDGLSISPAQVIDMARAAALVGWADRERLEDALACIVVDRLAARPRFDEAFARFFEVGAAAERDLWQRLRARGFGEHALTFLREALEAACAAGDEGALALYAWTRGGAELDRILGSRSIERELARVHHPRQVGSILQRVLDRGGHALGRRALALLRVELEGALGGELAAQLGAALENELERARRELRPHLQTRIAEAHGAAGALDAADLVAPFARLSAEQLARLRAAVRALAERLRGAARVRRKRQALGRLDAARTVRRALATSGVPFRPVRRRRRRARPRLVLLCDVSDSVRAASGLMLELVAALQELFERTRSFVFVRDVTEVTELLEAPDRAASLARIESGLAGATGDVSSYGRAFQRFDERFGEALDANTTLVILADGRTNYLPDGAEWLPRWRARVERIVWLCPEPRAAWSIGDSAMAKYAAAADLLLPLTSIEEFERAARRLSAGG